MNVLKAVITFPPKHICYDVSKYILLGKGLSNKLFFQSDCERIVMGEQ